MESYNEIIDLLINRRKDLINKMTNYSYQYLKNSINNISKCLLNSNNNNQNSDLNFNSNLPIIQPNNKIIYRILTGNYDNSKYKQSVIDWLPSEELINGIINIAEYFKIKSIEEVYAGLGILSALLQNKISNKKLEIIITTSDPKNNLTTCNQLNYIPIAKRTISDFNYYTKLNEKIPEMIICTYYEGIEWHNEVIEEINNLIINQRHSIIMIIFPQSNSLIHQVLYYALLDKKYQSYCYHIKAIDKYFHLTELFENNTLFEKYYPGNMLMYLLIKKELIPDTKLLDMEHILSDIIIPSETIDIYGEYQSFFILIYELFSETFIKNILKECNFNISFSCNKQYKKIESKIITLTEDYYVKNIPEHIHYFDEFMIWSNCITKLNIFVWHYDRSNFLVFISNIKKLENQTNPSKLNIFLPNWLYNKIMIYGYLYLDSIETNKKKMYWQQNISLFNKIFNEINEKNKTIIYGQTNKLSH